MLYMLKERVSIYYIVVLVYLNESENKILFKTSLLIQLLIKEIKNKKRYLFILFCGHWSYAILWFYFFFFLKINWQGRLSEMYDWLVYIEKMIFEWNCDWNHIFNRLNKNCLKTLICYHELLFFSFLSFICNLI